MKTRTCEVSLEYARMDVDYDNVRFRGATLQGAGGVMGDASVDGWTDVAARFRMMQRRDEMVRIYTALAEGGKREFFDARAKDCKLLAVYAPGYEVQHRVLVNRAAD